jgi:hypothetical protein
MAGSRRSPPADGERICAVRGAVAAALRDAVPGRGRVAVALSGGGG